MDGTYGLRFTMADVMGSGFTVDAMYSTDVGSGDAQAAKSTSGELGGTSGDGTEIVVKGSVPMVEGLDIGIGYYEQDTEATVTTGLWTRRRYCLHQVLNWSSICWLPKRCSSYKRSYA